MFKTFRRMSKSSIGTVIIVLVGLMILAGFAIGDLQGLGGGARLNSTTLAKVGSLELTDQDASSAMQRRLAQVREQNPEATYATIAADFDPLMANLIDERSLRAFAEQQGFVISKRLVDAEIAQLPGVRGLNGQVSQDSYNAFLARQRMTDAELRTLVTASLLERLLVTPAASSPQISVGVATPYASMLLEQREGQVAFVPLSLFAAGLNPTDAQLQQYYQSVRSRYMVPEQRVLKIAEIGPDQVNVAATPQEIEAYYKSRQADYAARDIRSLSQAVVPDQKVAAGIAQRARAGQAFAQAAAPAGLGADDVALGDQTRADFADVAGDAVAAQAFSAQQGAIIGPVQSSLGWHVIKVDSVKTQSGKTLAQARDEIAAAISKEKQQSALGTLVDRVQDAIDDGANFDQAAKAANLTVVTTPLVTATGASRTDAAYKLPETLVPALKSGFELAPTDDPVIEQLGDDGRFALVAPAQVVSAAPAPLASIRDQVRRDWITKTASDQAMALAKSIGAKASGKTSLADAVKASGRQLPPIGPMRARRIQLTQGGEQVPAPLRALFSTASGKTQVGALQEAPGFFIVKVDKIIPGNALNQPGLISSVQKEFQQPLAQEYGDQFLAAVRESVKVRRNEEAIAAAKKRITSGE
ncbi:peptidyl-prolyl cis-trans isomerase [Sphingomonas sabuli]|uniref:Parvulin-like PPIase n=1 Tax=Sphingomonas sabuli TaxID=2764186 RepID=A0A7G9L2W7_9SPHN|nr:peptidylprolyl isomerase [Sphingomonas sabuli]QNM82966.1 peptidyl-prolyl cis-trans isomerase [Sphingomonas sabuli]